LLAIPALALAGAPFTSGAMVKGLVKPDLAALVAPWGDALVLALTASTLGTTLLMARFLVLVGAHRAAGMPSPAWITLPWLGLISLVLGWPFLSGIGFPPLSTSWPVLAGCLLALPLVWMRPAWIAGLVGRIPPGDLLGPLTRVGAVLGRWMQGLWGPVAAWGFARIGRLQARVRPARATWPDAADQALQSWPLAGVLFLGIADALFALASLSS
jgi:hypothetical protein